MKRPEPHWSEEDFEACDTHSQVEYLMEYKARLENYIIHLETQNQKYREALAFYGDRSNWIFKNFGVDDMREVDFDRGHKAREAMKEDE